MPHVSSRKTPPDVPATSLRAPGETRGPLSAKLTGGWSLEAGFEAWASLREAHRLERERLAEERRRLEDQGRFLLGAVRAASAPTSPPESPAEAALAPLEALPSFVREAEEKLAEARAELEGREARLEARIQEEETTLERELRERVERFASTTRPSLVLWLRPVGSNRRILQLERVSPDESVLLLFALTGKLPSRYGFLFDDATEDLSLPPPPLYSEHGVAAGEERPEVPALRERLERGGEVLPIKTFIPVFVPRAEASGGTDFFRLLQRGAVMEVELAEGAAFRNVLTTDEAERFAGHLLRLKLSGKLELELKA